MVLDPWSDGCDPWSKSCRNQGSLKCASFSETHAQRLLATIVKAGASRHQVVALGSALWRLEVAHEPPSEVDRQVQYCLAALEPCVRAQVRAALDGVPTRSSAGLVFPDVHVIGNAAKHMFDV